MDIFKNSYPDKVLSWIAHCWYQAHHVVQSCDSAFDALTNYLKIDSVINQGLYYTQSDAQLANHEDYSDILE